MVFLKLVHTEYQVNHKTQPFWVKVVHLVPNVQTLAGHAVGTIHLAPTTTLHFDTVQWNLDLRKLDLRKNLDLRKIVATTDCLVHKLSDLRKIF